MKKSCTLSILAGTAAVVLATSLSARAEYRLEKNLKLDPGGSFVLNADEGSVTVTGMPGAGARVVITANREDAESFFSFGFDEGAGMARVTARRKHHPSWGKGVSIHYEVKVPTQAQLEIKTADGNIDTSGLRGDADLGTGDGNIEVSGLVGRLTAHTGDGNINLREVSGNAEVQTNDGRIDVTALDGALSARTGDGSIRLEKVTGDIIARTGDGSIHIQDAGGRVEAKTGDGKVEVALVKGNARGGELETGDGSVRIVLDPAVSLNVEASTTDSSITTNLPIKVSGVLSGSHLAGSLGSGGALLLVRAHDGPVHIEARQ
jgi:hypothetical protein